MVLHSLRAPLDAYARLDISPASVTALSMDGEWMTLHSVNERVGA